MKRGVKREFGHWFFDVAKYVATAIVVTSFLGEFSEHRLVYYGIGALLVCSCLIVGAVIINKTEK